MKLKQRNQGFSLIEVTVYLAITTVTLLVMTNFMIDVVKQAAKTKTTREVYQNARLLLSRLAQEIRTADSINTVTTESITLTKTNGATPQTIIFYRNSDNQVYVKVDANAPANLSNNKIRVTNLQFQQITPNSVSLSLSVAQLDPSAPQNQAGQTTLSSLVTTRQLIY